MIYWFLTITYIQARIPLNVATYNTLLSMHANNNNNDGVNKVISDMKQVLFILIIYYLFLFLTIIITYIYSGWY